MTHKSCQTEFKLDEILNVSRHGSLIIEYYKKHGRLNDGILEQLW